MFQCYPVPSPFLENGARDLVLLPVVLVRKVSKDATGQQLMVLGCLISVTGHGMNAVLGGVLEVETGEWIQLWMLYIGLRTQTTAAHWHIKL